MPFIFMAATPVGAIDKIFGFYGLSFLFINTFVNGMLIVLKRCDLLIPAPPVRKI